MADHVATAAVEVSASPHQVWAALTDPVQVKKYMFGADVESDWQPGSRVVWRGDYEGRRFEDKGQVLEADPGRLLKVTHFSPLSGQQDVPENYHTLTYELEAAGDRTRVSLTQDNNSSPEEAEHSRRNWEMMLGRLKEVVESG
ncbi:MAG TPA: SRPBCC domain-containing protein [Nocardioidaceae bacterium]